MSISNIYVINLEHHKSKKERIIKRLKNAQIFDKTIIFNAINGNNIDNNFLMSNNIKIYDNWSDPNTKRPITKGEIGCSLSHLIIWKEIVERNLTNA